jgi:hypothetical protein
LILIALAAALSAPAQAATLQRVVVDPVQYPDARCNDGTAAVFYFWEAATKPTDNWVVYLEGGASCNDDASCTDRFMDHPRRMGTGCMGPGDCDASYGVYSDSGSDHIDNAVEKFGIFTAGGSYFQDWNKVHIEYCSSDNWTGMGGESGKLTGFQSEYSHGNAEFNGHHIIEAVIDMLSNRTIGPQITAPGAQVLFGGGSAGSAGAQHNLDFIADTLVDADVRGLFDASFTGSAAFDSANPTVCSSQLEVGTMPSATPQGRIDSYDYRQSFLDESCVAEAQADGLHPAICATAAYRYRNDHISTPFFVIQAQLDYMPVGNLNSNDDITHTLQQIHGPGYTQTMDDRRQCTIEKIRSFGSAAASNVPAFEGWYVPCEQWHVVAPKTNASQQKINGESARSALRNWYKPNGLDYTLVESCSP